jgi:hypothetical protein
MSIKVVSFSIHRKLTQTYVVTNNDSCHPYEHKLSSINYLLNKLHTYPIAKEAKEAELKLLETCYTINSNQLPLLPQKQNTLIFNTRKQNGPL